MEKKWIKTEQMLEKLKQEPDTEQEYSLYLGGILRSTHWLSFSLQRNKFSNSTIGAQDSWFTEAEFLELYAGHWWMKE